MSDKLCSRTFVVVLRATAPEPDNLPDTWELASALAAAMQNAPGVPYRWGGPRAFNKISDLLGTNPEVPDLQHGECPACRGRGWFLSAYDDNPDLITIQRCDHCQVCDSDLTAAHLSGLPFDWKNVKPEGEGVHMQAVVHTSLEFDQDSEAVRGLPRILAIR